MVMVMVIVIVLVIVKAIVIVIVIVTTFPEGSTHAESELSGLECSCPLSIVQKV